VSHICILVADNNIDFLGTLSNLLETAGYAVCKAANPTEATRILRSKLIHLAVIDMRLTNDTDENDISGLILAKNVERSIPKVILTQYPTVDAARTALRPDSSGLPPAVDFIDKRMKNLVGAIQESLFKYVNLENGSNETNRLRQLILDKFSAAELSELCFELGLRYADLEGNTRGEKIMSLLDHFERRNHLPVLIRTCRKHRQDF